MERGSGLTTQQLRDAPAKAAFIWCNEHLNYVRALALYLGRSDLVLLTPDRLEHGGSLSGYGHVIMDHAFRPNEKQRLLLEHFGVKCCMHPARH